MDNQNRWNNNAVVDNVIPPHQPPKPDTSVAFPRTEEAPKDPVIPVPTVSADQTISTPVVKVLSVRGLEYLMMSISLWFGAGGLLWGVLTAINGGTSFAILALPASLALVGILIFAGFFIRLKKAELKDPSLRLDASKRRSSQITQIVSFLVLFFNLITFVYLVFANLGGKSSVSIGKAAVNLLVVTAIAGGILSYYWVNEHRAQR
jgi:hypothetical protein